MWREAIGADQNWQPLLNLFSGVINDVVRPMYATTNQRWVGMLETLIMRADTHPAVKALLLDPAIDEAADRLDED